MNKQQKTSLIIILIGLLLIVTIIYFFFLKGPRIPGQIINEPELPAGQLPIVEPDDETPGDRPRERTVYDISQEDEHQINQTDLAKISSIFAERLGSYSNQSNYSNYDDINIFMTASMRDWARGYVDKIRQDNPYDGNYYGITTWAISTEVKKFEDKPGTAEIIVNTQRREVSAVNGEEIYNQDLRLTFIKENNQWLVDGAYWLK